MATKPKADVSAEPTADEQVRTYELVGLVPGSLNEKDAQKVVADVKKLVAKSKGEILVEDIWARRDLTYPIRGEMQAAYLVLDFTGAPSTMKALNKALNLESKLIRFSIMSMPASYRYVSIATLTAQAAEAKEAPAPGLERAPARRAAPKAAKPVAKDEPSRTGPTKNLDDALKSLDETL